MVYLKTVEFVARHRDIERRSGLLLVGNTNEAFSLKELACTVEISRSEVVSTADGFDVEVELSVGATAHRDAEEIAEGAVDIADETQGRVVAVEIPSEAD